MEDPTVLERKGEWKRHGICDGTDKGEGERKRYTAWQRKRNGDAESQGEAKTRSTAQLKWEELKGKQR